MVKKENIRFTHFSRNPKIAAFLKEYGYVKEYGEGVDRMCRELEDAGLPDPVFNNSTFILKTTVMSTTWQKRPIQTAKPADSTGNQPIGAGKPADSNTKCPIGVPKVSVSDEKCPFQPSKVSDSGSTKISAAAFAQAYLDKGYREATIQTLDEVYDQLETNQVFGSAYLMKVLECPERAARRILAKLRSMNVVVPISGRGKGMYRLKNADEE